jgi:hypothetical protein
MASDDVKKDEGKGAAARAADAAERARKAAEAAHDADNIAADAGREAEYDADHSSAGAVQELAAKTVAEAAKVHDAAHDAKEASHQAERCAGEAEEAEEAGQAEEAEKAAGEAEEAASRAEAAAEVAQAAQKAAVEAAREADRAKIASDDQRGYGEEHVTEDTLPKERRPALYLAEFESPGECMHAAERVRDAGYQNWDVHTPYPVHGMETAMGLKGTQLGWVSMAAGMIGLVTAVVMIYFMNASEWDVLGFRGYPLIVGGKPPGAFPSMVPIMFELSILLTGFATLLGLLHFARLPRHHHPVFESERFAAASDDKFFISVETADPKFDLDETRKLLESLSPTHIELVEEEA